MGAGIKKGHGFLSHAILSFLDKVRRLSFMPSSRIDSHCFHEADTIVISLTAACILYTRSVGVVYFAAGASTCSITVKLIKRAIRQPRPPPHVLVGRRVKVSFG